MGIIYESNICVTLTEVAAFIDTVRAVKPARKPMPGHMSLETRKTSKSLYMEIERNNDR